LKKIAWYALLLPFLMAFTGCSHMAPAGPAAEPDLAALTIPRPVEKTAASTKVFKKERLNTSAAARDLSESKKIQTTLDDALDFCQMAQDAWQAGELEKAIDALDQAYDNIIKVDTEDNPKVIQQKEDLRFMISKRILEIYASRNIVVSGSHNAIPVIVNTHVQYEIDRFTSGAEKKFFEESYQRSGLYRPYIVEALKEVGLPEELSWLPLIESGYKVGALSTARALGLWQFIPSTGYKFGLNRDRYVDQRMDPYRSTTAAIDYLRELHQIFGDWTTVLAAYNCGEGRVLRVIRDQNVNYLDNFWDLYERLPRETARYVPRFLATLHIVSNPEKYGLNRIPTLSPLPFETVTVQRQAHLRDIALQIGVSEQDLQALNPELRFKILPSGSYPLRVPPEKSDLLLASIDRVPLSTPPSATHTYAYHRVKPGENLSSIAQRYHTSVQKIMRANNLQKSHHIVTGKRLKIPVKEGMVLADAKPSGGNPKATTHVVRRGDSLWNLAKRYDTTTAKIQKLNKLHGTHLYVGQVLKVQETGRTAAKDENARTYRVQKGDTPFKIAQQNNITLKRFMRLNQLTDNSKIFPGQVVLVEN
jgi:membrane-bound lytic murein transglycosylase D